MKSKIWLVLALGLLLSLVCLLTDNGQKIIMPLNPQGKDVVGPQGKTAAVEGKTITVAPQGETVTVTPKPDQRDKPPTMTREELVKLCGKYYKEHNTTYEHPSIVQYAKLRNESSSVSLTFMEYMSMMSVHKLLRPERILIHSYTSITGTYWDLVQKWRDVSVEVNRIKHVEVIDGKEVNYLSHQADYIKLQALLEFGGVISDFDVVILKGDKIKFLQGKSECILSEENTYVNAGFASCVKNSSYIRDWLDTYNHDYHPSEWMYNAGLRPKQILTENQKFYSKICLVDGIATHPASWKGFEGKWLAKKGVKWQEKIAAHYFNKNKQCNETVLKEDHSFAEMMRFISSHV